MLVATELVFPLTVVARAVLAAVTVATFVALVAIELVFPVIAVVLVAANGNH